MTDTYKKFYTTVLNMCWIIISKFEFNTWNNNDYKLSFH